MKRGLAPLVVLLVMWAAGSAEACSLAIQLEERPDRLVMLAEITGKTSGIQDGMRMHGVKIEPRLVFQAHRYSLDDSISLFPQGLGAACNHIPVTQPEYIDAGYPPGRLVAIYAVPQSSETVSSLRMMGMIDFDLLADGCSLEQITLARPDYAQFQERCGSRFFHAYREIAGLASASADERFDVLSRLAEFPEFVYFRTLVEQNEPDADQARRLIEARYADVIASGCENRPPAEYEIDSTNMDQIVELRTFRLRWHEYCSNR